MVLHNLVREKDEARNEDLLENGGFTTYLPLLVGQSRNLRSAEAIRNAFADYVCLSRRGTSVAIQQNLALDINFCTERCKYWPTNIWVYGPCKIFSNVIYNNL